MPTIGETLREARMRQRLDIADVERRTKIRAKYLRALENEEFALLPGPTFVKTFLRTYAELLGLDPHALVEQYRLHHETSDELAQLQPLGPPGPARERRRQPGRRGPGPGAWVLLGIVGVLVFLVVLGLRSEDDDGGGRAARTQTTAGEPDRAPRRPERPAARPARVRLRVAPTVPTYVCVDTGEGTDVRFEGILDQPRSFRAPTLRVNIGMTAVDVRANGRPVPIEPGPDPVGFEFTPESTEPLPLGERPCA